MSYKFNGQVAQDYFVLICHNFKKNGTFLEIGSNDPININNTYNLESQYDWKGILVEYDQKFEEGYKMHRPKSNYVIADATKIDYTQLLNKFCMPKEIDYLQIDLEVNNRSTLDTLENLETNVLSDYKFAVVTFEHDIYTGDYFNTKQKSRDIFEKYGYVRVFSDVRNEMNPFEDWYVHPDLIDQNVVNILKTSESLEYREIVKKLNQVKL